MRCALGYQLGIKKKGKIMALSRKYYQGLAEALARPTEGYGAGALAKR